MNYSSTDEKCLHTRMWTPPLEKLLRRWKRQIGRRSSAHIVVSRELKRRHYFLGIPSTVLSAIVATGILTTFENCDPADPNTKCTVFEWIRLTLGVIGMFGAVLEALHIFLNHQKRSQKNKKASNDYEAMYRELDTLILVPRTMRGDPVTTLQGIKNRYDDIVKRSPTLPRRYDIELTYQYIGEQGIVPPSSSVVGTSSSETVKLSNSAVIDLMKVVSADREPAHMKRAEYDSSDDEAVAIPFDLDCEQGLDTTIAALAAVKLAAQERSLVDDSLLKALEFEMGRVQRPDGMRGGSPHSDSSPTSEGFTTVDIE